MIGTLLFGAILLYGLWKVFAVSGVLLVHRSDPDDKVVMIPLRGVDVWERPMAPVGFLRAMARAKRRKWGVISLYSLLAMMGLFESLGVALIGLLVVYVLMMAIDYFVMRRAKNAYA